MVLASSIKLTTFRSTDRRQFAINPPRPKGIWFIAVRPLLHPPEKCYKLIFPEWIPGRQIWFVLILFHLIFPHWFILSFPAVTTKPPICLQIAFCKIFNRTNMLFHATRGYFCCCHLLAEAALVCCLFTFLNVGTGESIMQICKSHCDKRGMSGEYKWMVRNRIFDSAKIVRWRQKSILFDSKLGIENNV